MSIFINYANNVNDAIFSTFVGESPERSNSYINGLFSKFNFLRRLSDEVMLRELKKRYAMFEDIAAGSEPVLQPYLNATIAEIRLISDAEAAKMRLMMENGSLATAMTEIGKQYSKGGDIYTILHGVDDTFTETYSHRDLTKGMDKQIAYEFKSFVDRLPQACWGSIVDMVNL